MDSTHEFIQRSGIQDDNLILSSTAVSSVEGDRKLYRGYSAVSLAEHSSFEEVVYLLWFGRLPRERELKDFSHRLWALQAMPSNSFAWLHGLPTTVHPLDFLHAVIAGLALHDPDANLIDRRANQAKATRLVARMGTIAAAFHRLQSQKWPLQPTPEQGIAWNLLYMTQGSEPDPARVRALDAYLILSAEDCAQLSTMSARVTSSTRSGVYSSIMAALGTMKGALHGTGSAAVLKILREIGDPQRVDTYLTKALSEKRVIPGFSPRSTPAVAEAVTCLKQISRDLIGIDRAAGSYRVARALEDAIRERSALVPTNDLYAATLLNAVHLPSGLFSAISAVARSAGWCAHILEQYDRGQVYRAAVSYVGVGERHREDHEGHGNPYDSA